MVAARSTVAVVIGFIIAVQGCGPGPANVVGNWQARIPLPPGGEAAPDVRNTLERVNLVLDGNGHYSMIWTGLPITGSYIVDGNTVHLQPKQALGRPVSGLSGGMTQYGKVIRLTLKSGKLETADMSGATVLFTKIGTSPKP